MKDKTIKDIITEKEYEKAMEEMMCFSVDNHLEKCPKHTKKMKDKVIKDLMKWADEGCK